MLRRLDLVTRNKQILTLGVGGGVSTAAALALYYFQDKKPMKQYIKPSFDAAMRAGRLAYTASQMVLDYRTLNGRVLDQNELNLDQEQEVLLWQEKLRIAQDDYTSTTQKNKQMQLKLKQAVHEAATKLAELEEKLFVNEFQSYNY